MASVVPQIYIDDINSFLLGEYKGLTTAQDSAFYAAHQHYTHKLLEQVNLALKNPVIRAQLPPNFQQFPGIQLTTQLSAESIDVVKTVIKTFGAMDTTKSATAYEGRLAAEVARASTSMGGAGGVYSGIEGRIKKTAENFEQLKTLSQRLERAVDFHESHERDPVVALKEMAVDNGYAFTSAQKNRQAPLTRMPRDPNAADALFGFSLENMRVDMAQILNRLEVREITVMPPLPVNGKDTAQFREAFAKLEQSGKWEQLAGQDRDLAHAAHFWNSYKQLSLAQASAAANALQTEIAKGGASPYAAHVTEIQGQRQALQQAGGTVPAVPAANTPEAALVELKKLFLGNREFFHGEQSADPVFQQMFGKAVHDLGFDSSATSALLALNFHAGIRAFQAAVLANPPQMKESGLTDAQLSPIEVNGKPDTATMTAMRALAAKPEFLKQMDGPISTFVPLVLQLTSAQTAQIAQSPSGMLRQAAAEIAVSTNTTKAVNAAAVLPTLANQAVLIKTMTNSVKAAQQALIDNREFFATLPGSASATPHLSKLYRAALEISPELQQQYAQQLQADPQYDIRKLSQTKVQEALRNYLSKPPSGEVDKATVLLYSTLIDLKDADVKLNLSNGQPLDHTHAMVKTGYWIDDILLAQMAMNKVQQAQLSALKLQQHAAGATQNVRAMAQLINSLRLNINNSTHVGPELKIQTAIPEDGDFKNYDFLHGRNALMAFLQGEVNDNASTYARMIGQKAEDIRKNPDALMEVAAALREKQGKNSPDSLVRFLNAEEQLGPVWQSLEARSYMAAAFGRDFKPQGTEADIIRLQPLLKTKVALAAIVPFDFKKDPANPVDPGFLQAFANGQARMSEWIAAHQAMLDDAGTLGVMNHCMQKIGQSQQARDPQFQAQFAITQLQVAQKAGYYSADDIANILKAALPADSFTMENNSPVISDLSKITPDAVGKIYGALQQKAAAQAFGNTDAEKALSQQLFMATLVKESSLQINLVNAEEMAQYDATALAQAINTPLQMPLTFAVMENFAKLTKNASLRQDAANMANFSAAALSLDAPTRTRINAALPRALAAAPQSPAPPTAATPRGQAARTEPPAVAGTPTPTGSAIVDQPPQLPDILATQISQRTSALQVQLGRTQTGRYEDVKPGVSNAMYEAGKQYMQQHGPVVTAENGQKYQLRASGNTITIHAAQGGKFSDESDGDIRDTKTPHLAAAAVIKRIVDDEAVKLTSVRLESIKTAQRRLIELMAGTPRADAANILQAVQRSDSFADAHRRMRAIFGEDRKEQVDYYLLSLWGLERAARATANNGPAAAGDSGSERGVRGLAAVSDIVQGLATGKVGEKLDAIDGPAASARIPNDRFFAAPVYQALENRKYDTYTKFIDGNLLGRPGEMLSKAEVYNIARNIYEERLTECGIQLRDATANLFSADPNMPTVKPALEDLKYVFQSLGPRGTEGRAWVARYGSMLDIGQVPTSVTHGHWLARDNGGDAKYEYRNVAMSGRQLIERMGEGRGIFRHDTVEGVGARYSAYEYFTFEDHGMNGTNHLVRDYMHLRDTVYTTQLQQREAGIHLVDPNRIVANAERNAPRFGETAPSVIPASVHRETPPAPANRREEFKQNCDECTTVTFDPALFGGTSGGPAPQPAQRP